MNSDPPETTEVPLKRLELLLFPRDWSAAQIAEAINAARAEPPGRSGNTVTPLPESLD